MILTLVILLAMGLIELSDLAGYLEPGVVVEEVQDIFFSPHL